MHWTVEYLVQAIREKRTGVRKIERVAGLAVNTIHRWKTLPRDPHIDLIDRALNKVGYRLAIIPLEPESENMNRHKLQIAMDEARRFIARAEALPAPEPYQSGNGDTYTHDNFPREQGAIKRASMDLTRALSDLRRPDR